jgi:mRNA interferase MazF
MKGNIVLVPFPFDDFSGVKLRPAVCLTGQIGKYNHLIVAFISSRLPEEKSASDIIIEPNERNGLKTVSVLRLHKMATIPASLIKRQLGQLSKQQMEVVNTKLSVLFNLANTKV